MRRAKIVGTLGPSSNTIETITTLIKTGLDVVRVNMSHGDHKAHQSLIENVRAASKEAEKEVAILLDLQGPKIRVDKLAKNLDLKKGETWVIGQSDLIKKYPEFNDHFIPTIYDKLVEDAKVGCTILFDDGLLEAKAIKKENDLLHIEIIEGGELKSNKGINLPDVSVSAPSLTEKDEEDLAFGLKEDIDYVALSFIREAHEIETVRKKMQELGKEVPIVAKIEKPEAVENIESIVKVTDVIMIARGDMGVEVGNHLVPSIQKKIITLCNNNGVPVITATQMLDSMIDNSRPTRAEASDVANAIWDGTDAVMLSGETASGKYPVHTVSMMDKIVLEAEKSPKVRPYLRDMDLAHVDMAIQVSASLIAEKIQAKKIITITESGNSCLKLSSFRPKTEVLGVTGSLSVVRKMSMYWGVRGFYYRGDLSRISTLQRYMIQLLTNSDQTVKTGDRFVVSVGDGEHFNPLDGNSVRVETIK